jgi:16S rRNA (uracil1498-N3)-methyltransferase
MQRFFVPPETLMSSEVRIDGEVARQISRVLRMQLGDQVCLVDGAGWEYVVRLAGFGKEYATGEIVEKRQGGSEPQAQVTLYLSLLNKVDKFEWALQKCTEIGAACFVPVRATRSISDMPGEGKAGRWERIVQEAAEQSGRCVLPTLDRSSRLLEVLDHERNRLQQSTKSEHIAIMPALGAHCSLREALAGKKQDGGSISIFIGPEGGFTEEETNAAQQAGITLVTLGPRILRAETAAVAALTMTLYELGEMESAERETRNAKRKR